MGPDHIIDGRVLIDLLRNLPHGSHVVPNPAHNLSISKDGEYIGYIDLSNDTVIIFPKS